MQSIAMTIRILSLFLFLLFSAQGAFAEILSVNGENVNLRSGPGTNYPVKWEYGKGFPLKVVDRKGPWLKVADFEKDTGWIHQSLLVKDPHVIVEALKNTDKKINIRKGPSTNDTVVGQAYYGVVFKSIESKSGWTKVRHESGLEGWISDNLLWGK